MIKPTIAEYLMNRLVDLGIKDVFGVPGDYNFHIAEAVEKNPELRWIGCCNELNSAYAADGYARINGIGAVITTYGVGELSAINGFAGSAAENVPVISIVGMPKTDLLKSQKHIHHSLSTPEIFKEIYSKIGAYAVILNEHNAQSEIEKALSICYNYKKPVYIAIPADICILSVKITTNYFEPLKSDENNLKKAVAHIKKLVQKAENPLIISEFPILRFKLKEKMQDLIDKTNIPYTSMVLGKSSIDESGKSFIGIYCGDLSSPNTLEVIENSDCILGFGIMMTDYNTGIFTADIDFDKVIDIQFHYVKIKNIMYENIYITDVIDHLVKELEPKEEKHFNFILGYKDEKNEKLTHNDIFYELQEFLSYGDNFIAEIGLSGFGAAPMRLKKGVNYISQSFWGSIGWATPACLGVAIADTGVTDNAVAGNAANSINHTILITGEGSHQMSFQDVSSIARYCQNPIIIVINNDGYTIERLLCKNPDDSFNDIAKWDYTALAKCFSDKFITFKVKTKKDFSNALKKARNENSPVYIEVFTEKMDSADFVKNLAKIAKC